MRFAAPDTQLPACFGINAETMDDVTAAADPVAAYAISSASGFAAVPELPFEREMNQSVN